MIQSAEKRKQILGNMRIELRATWSPVLVVQQTQCLNKGMGISQNVHWEETLLGRKDMSLLRFLHNHVIEYNSAESL